jgi:hypothetical protein
LKTHQKMSNAHVNTILVKTLTLDNIGFNTNKSEF